MNPVPAPLSLPFVVMTVLSLLLGVGTQVIQTGTLFGRWVTPKTWLPTVVMIVTFVGGAVAYLGGLTPVVITQASVFGAIVAGITQLFIGAAPGVAQLAHVVAPHMVAQARAVMRAQNNFQSSNAGSPLDLDQPNHESETK
jgi:hypothetical protein